MSKYVKCSPHIEYEVTRDNKVVYRGTDKATMKIILEALLDTKKGDVYVYEHRRRRYMLLDDEEYQELNEKRNTKNAKK